MTLLWIIWPSVIRLSILRGFPSLYPFTTLTASPPRMLTLAPASSSLWRMQDNSVLFIAARCWNCSIFIDILIWRDCVITSNQKMLYDNSGITGETQSHLSSLSTPARYGCGMDHSIPVLSSPSQPLLLPSVPPRICQKNPCSLPVSMIIIPLLSGICIYLFSSYPIFPARLDT